MILQLQDQPAHDFWADDRHIPVPRAPRGSLSIVDLRRDSSALFTERLDSLHLHLPREALEGLAIDAGATPVGTLTLDGEWSTSDEIARQLSPLLAAAAEAPGRLAQAYIDHLVLAMAAHVASTYGGLRPMRPRRGSLAPWQLRRAQELLSQSLSGEVSLHAVAEACGLSTSYFARAFKVSTGMPPHAWLQARRIERARGLLSDRRLALADIALRCGFADQSHFTRAFRRATGLTPALWRRAAHPA
ncbi:helix-turn-helix transcriptional regulator [Roseixanthobacter liquoris]|uniref:helix-turn-helix transcriptional regulator n=1 Tax=Roseixanthobacter liquoris TaxID=3119921 RepID=UPI00372C783B